MKGLDPGDVIMCREKILPDDADPVLQAALRWLSRGAQQ
jgi:hypothetical protein